jgi:hypothetical protein
MSGKRKGFYGNRSDKKGCHDILKNDIGHNDTRQDVKLIVKAKKF